MYSCKEAEERFSELRESIISDYLNRALSGIQNAVNEGKASYRMVFQEFISSEIRRRIVEELTQSGFSVLNDNSDTLYIVYGWAKD